MDPTKNYYEAFKTDFKKIDGAPADTDEDHILNISLYLEHENELNNLGFEFYGDEEEEDDDVVFFEDGYYLRNKKLGVVRMSLECPSTLLSIDDFQEKALELLKIKSEWVKYLSVDG